ncbi:MAG TPA: ATP-binding cassette domain-containing protein [Chitinophagales bacterium]|nr:ATP-binding cassette domain-containing protein [Chitinophagales bacterium]
MNIRVEGLTKTYGAQRAVDNISFEVKTGEILGFLGPNGAGKTTTMKIITCYMAPTSGRAYIGNLNILEHQEEVKKKIGYLPENNPLYTDMYVIEYLEFMAGLQGVPATAIKDRVIEMVRKCGLDAEKHKKIGELSKGYRQRVGLAQAMIHNPDVLILDEPTTGLDPNQIVEIRKLIKELGREKTVILSTHILPEVEATCDRILIISNGKIVADGSPDTLRKQAQGQEVLKVTIENGEANSIIKGLQSLDTVAMVDPISEKQSSFTVQSRPNASSRRAVFELCVKNNWILTELTPLETKLEDIFRNLTMN